MANSPQAKKRAHQSEKKRCINSNNRSAMRTHIKRVLKAISEKNKTLALKEYQLTTSKLDKLSNKGLIHKNKAARYKSRLNNQIKCL